MTGSNKGFRGPQVHGSAEIGRRPRAYALARPHLAEDGVGAEGALLDAAVRGSRRAEVKHLMLLLLLLLRTRRRERLAVLPAATGGVEGEVAGVGGGGAAEAERGVARARVGPGAGAIGGGRHGGGRGHGTKVPEGSGRLGLRDLGAAVAVVVGGRRRFLMRGCWAAAG